MLPLILSIVSMFLSGVAIGLSIGHMMGKKTGRMMGWNEAYMENEIRALSESWSFSGHPCEQENERRATEGKSVRARVEGVPQTSREV